MGQEFFINSQQLQNKVAQLLPSQGGAGEGFDLSASSQIVPIVDLTESAEGSNVRQDIQRANSFSNNTAFKVVNAVTTIITSTGYFRIIGTSSLTSRSSGARTNTIDLSDGATFKTIWGHEIGTSSTDSFLTQDVDITVFLAAGDSCRVVGDTSCSVYGSFRQIADIDGNLTNPT